MYKSLVAIPLSSLALDQARSTATFRRFINFVLSLPASRWSIQFKFYWVVKQNWSWWCGKSVLDRQYLFARLDTAKFRSEMARISVFADFHHKNNFAHFAYVHRGQSVGWWIGAGSKVSLVIQVSCIKGCSLNFYESFLRQPSCVRGHFHEIHLFVLGHGTKCGEGLCS